jgi:hypothetical protein
MDTLLLDAEITWGAAQSHAMRTLGSAAVDPGYVAKAAITGAGLTDIGPWSLSPEVRTAALVRGWVCANAGDRMPAITRGTGLLRIRRVVPYTWRQGGTAVCTLKAVAIRKRTETIGGRIVRRQIDAAASATTQGDRHAAYRAWLFERLDGKGCRIERTTVESARMVRAVRRTAVGSVEMDRAAREFLQPEVVYRVGLTITDPSAFRLCLLTGIGPQKAFGYGALLPE